MPPIEIKENAIFIADSHHHCSYRNTLEDFFASLLKTPKRQIFLMGDIFDFLVGEVPKSVYENKKTLELLEKLSLQHEIHYFEGNHDFSLKNIPYLRNIRCYPIEMQPVCFSFNQKNAYLSHGDIFLSWHYKLYTKIIRNHKILSFLNRFSRFLYPKILQYLQNKKNLTFHYSDDFIQNRIRNYKNKYPITDNSYIIEGHFHLGKTQNIDSINYIGLPLFACKKSYFIVEFYNYYLCFKSKEF